MTFGVTPIEEQSVWGVLFRFFPFFTPHPVNCRGRRVTGLGDAQPNRLWVANLGLGL